MISEVWSLGYWRFWLNLTPRPDGINGLELWLDQNDSTTLFADLAMTTPASSGIALWKDKSGNTFNLEQATSSSRPIYDSSNSRVTFNNQT